MVENNKIKKLEKDMRGKEKLYIGRNTSGAFALLLSLNFPLYRSQSWLDSITFSRLKILLCSSVICILSDVPSTSHRTSQSTQSVLVLLLDRQIFLLLQPIPQPGKCYYFPF